MINEIIFGLLFSSSIIASQTTDTVLMVSPDSFMFNKETEETNSFQHIMEGDDIVLKAKTDFYNMQEVLIQNGIRVITLNSPKDKKTPDAVFPTNWFSFHKEDGKNLLVLYPLLNANRQIERQETALEDALKDEGIVIDDILDLTYFELEGKALEGTGSVLFDRENKVVYASISPRTHLEVLRKLTEKINYTIIPFSSQDEKENLIYHTDIMMSIGSKFAVLCKDSIRDPIEVENVVSNLTLSGKKIIYITLDQMREMCGNILEVQSQGGKTKIVMSKTAYNAFTQEQLELLSQFGEIIFANISTIEFVGGGSTRCMLAEIFR
ncbi:MAG: amidinotransferase [Verrucomicrobia bacterium]|nr:amidinotransferase [Verrucomicrobiota bacterium]